MTQDSPAATNTPVSAECNANDAQGCTETFVYRQDGVPLELLYTPAKNNLTQRYWYETDAHGSVVALTDAAGNVVDHYTYLGPWGDLDTLHSAEAVPQPLRYRGYVYDRELLGRAETSGWCWMGLWSYTILASDFAGSTEIVVAPRRHGATLAGCTQGRSCPCGGRIAAVMLDCSQDRSTASCEEGICRA